MCSAVIRVDRPGGGDHGVETAFGGDEALGFEGDGRARGVALPTTTLAAGTWGTVGIDHHVPELAEVAVGSEE